MHPLIPPNTSQSKLPICHICRTERMFTKLNSVNLCSQCRFQFYMQWNVMIHKTSNEITAHNNPSKIDRSFLNYLSQPENCLSKRTFKDYKDLCKANCKFCRFRQSVFLIGFVPNLDHQIYTLYKVLKASDEVLKHIFQMINIATK